MENLIDIWGKRNPDWEVRHEDFIKAYSDYGRGNSQYLEDRGKVYGAGYEIFIIAFFVGLYFDRRRKLPADPDMRKHFGWPVQNWGNIEERNKRQPYSKLRDYIFAALVARTDFDIIALEKGDVSERVVVDALMTTMEEYANYGFYYMEEMVEDNSDCFFKNGAFLQMFIPFYKTDSTQEEGEDDGPESLD